MTNTKPLVLDVDGTFLKTDMLLECFWAGLGRDPLATLYSCIRTPFADPALSFTVGDWARFYGLYQALMARWQPLAGEQLLEIDYEQLVSNLPHEARRLVDFLGLEWDPACLHPERSGRVVHTASFSQVRHGVHTGSVDLWRRNEEAIEALRPLIGEAREAVERGLAD